MAKEQSAETPRRGRPALSPEAQNNKLIALAVDQIEEQLRSGKASSQILAIYAKMAVNREKERLEKEVLLLHQDSVMWSRFIETIACCAGYSFEKKEKWKITDVGALKELASCGFIDSDGTETTFNMYDVNDYVEDVQAYAVMRLQRMIQKKRCSDNS